MYQSLISQTSCLCRTVYLPAFNDWITKAVWSQSWGEREDVTGLLAILEQVLIVFSSLLQIFSSAFSVWKPADSPILLYTEHCLEQKLEVFLLSCMFLKYFNTVLTASSLRLRFLCTLSYHWRQFCLVEELPGCWDSSPATFVHHRLWAWNCPCFQFFQSFIKTPSSLAHAVMKLTTVKSCAWQKEKISSGQCIFRHYLDSCY